MKGRGFSLCWLLGMVLVLSGGCVSAAGVHATPFEDIAISQYVYGFTLPVPFGTSTISIRTNRDGDVLALKIDTQNGKFDLAQEDLKGLFELGPPGIAVDKKAEVGSMATGTVNISFEYGVPTKIYGDIDQECKYSLVRPIIVFSIDQAKGLRVKRVSVADQAPAYK